MIEPTSRSATAAYDLIAAWKLDPELRQWRRAGVRPRLWWRDDDARAPSVALDRLLSAAEDRPIALAVIPNSQVERLAERLASAPNVRVGQHGVDHVNKNPADVAPSEYGPAPSSAEMAEAITAARTTLHRAGLKPDFFTPPWNVCQPGLGAALSASGYDLLSAGPETPLDSDLAYLPTEVDVLRWRGGPRFRGGMRIATALAKALRRRRLAGACERPIGLLTHHLVHDDQTWRFLDWLITFIDRNFDLVGVDDLAAKSAGMTKGVAAMSA